MVTGSLQTTWSEDTIGSKNTAGVFAVEVGVFVAVGEDVKVLVGVAVLEGVEVEVRLGVGVKVFVGVSVRDGVAVGVSVVVGVEEGVEVNVFVRVGAIVGKNEGINGLASGNPNMMINAIRTNAIIRIKPPVNQRPPALPDLRGAICPYFNKTK